MAVDILMSERHQRRIRLSTDRVVYQRAWKVIVTETDTGQGASVADFTDIMTVINATVQIGSQYPDATQYECNNIDVTENEDGEITEVTASYEIPTKDDIPDDFDEFMNRSNGEGADDPNNPFRPRRSGSGQAAEEYRWKDLANKAFVNKAGDRLTNIPPIHISIQVDRITVNEAGMAPTGLVGRCNGRRLLAAVSYEEKDHKNKSTGQITRYYVNTYEVWTHPDRDWEIVEVMNCGWRRIVNGELEMVKDTTTGEYAASESNLSKDGTEALAAGVEPNYCEFKVRYTADLNIPFL